MKFKLWFQCRNGGDGSVSVHFHPDKQSAEQAEEAMSEGWGESSVDYIELSITNGTNLTQLFSHPYGTNPATGKFEKLNVEVIQEAELSPAT